MKKINDDARVLIRSYIESVEEYLKSTCKMHPNEIDTLLTEINDFMFIRSHELAKGDSVSHSDVLNAMEECGSPSDICEQYLESESEAASSLSSTQSGSKNKVSRKPSSSTLGKTDIKKFSSSSISSETYLNQLRNSKLFAIYRFISAFTLVILIIYIIVTPFGDWGRFRFSLYDINYLIDQFFGIGTMWVFGFVFVEGWLIPKWKNQLAARGFLRGNDDAIIILIARAGFLILLIKATLFPTTWRFLIFFPVLLGFQALLERQFNSRLWTSVLSPLLLTMARSIDTGNILTDIRQILQNWINTLRYYPVYEKVTLFLGGSFLLLSLLFPWLYGWNGDEFNTIYLIVPLNIHLLITLLILIGTIFVSFTSEQKSDSKLRLNMVSFWIGRLIGIRAIMMLNSYYFHYYSFAKSFLAFLLILTYLFYEATIGFQRHMAVKKSIVSGLQYLGQDHTVVSSVTSFPASQSKPDVTTVSNRVSSSFSRVPSRETKDSSLQVSSVQNYDSSPRILRRESKIRRMLRGSSSIVRSLISILIIVLTPVVSFIKAIAIAFILLLGSVYEVLLFLLIILTGTSGDGSFVIPIYSFSFQYNTTVLMGGYTIWSWYLLGALTAQIFLLVVVEWFQFVRKKPDGLILVFFRNFSRLLLLVLFLGSVYQGISGDLYAPLRIIIMIVLFIFMELTSLKVRLERRKWSNNSFSSSLESETDDQRISRVINNQI